MKSKKLSRQFQKTFKTEEPEAEMQKLDEWLRNQVLPESIKAAFQVVHEFSSFTDVVEHAYQQYEKLIDVSNRSLEISSKELTESNKTLSFLNQSIEALMNSLGQGFLVVDPEGTCLPIYSKACLDLLECVPAGKAIAEVLRIPENSRKDFNDWCKMLFSEVIEFDDLAELGPQTFEHSAGRYVALEFKPIRRKDGTVEAVVVVATDRTKERAATKQAEEKQLYAEMIVKLAKDKNQFFNYVRYAREKIEELRKPPAGKVPDFVTIKRVLHTLKGGAASFFISSLKMLIHGFESEVDELQRGTEAKSPQEIGRRLREAGNQIEDALNRFLAEHRELLGKDFEHGGHVKEIPTQNLYAFAHELAQLPYSDLLIRKFLEHLVAVPIGSLFRQYNAGVQELAGRLGKQVRPIHIQGEDLPILDELYEEVFATLVHVFRNAVDHGLETPEERELLGKSPGGHITVNISKETADDRHWIRMVIEDDGRGIDPAKIRARLEAAGTKLAPGATDLDVIQRIFDDGISTAATVTDISGRGVGLSAFKSAVEAMGGTVRVETRLREGTSFHVQIPYLWKLAVETPAATSAA